MADVRSGPLASVVINNYNYARFVGEAIESALAQTYAPLEVVVVDDGSTDTSRAVIGSYGGRVIPVFQANGGMAAALNSGFAASAGAVVVFLDSDDALLPTALATAVELLHDPDVARVHWPMREIDGAGAETGRLMPSWPLAEGNLREVVARKGPMGANGSPTSGNAWPRWFLDRVLPMPEADLRQHADAYLNTLSSVHGAVRRSAQPLGRYRVHGGNDYATRPMIERLQRNLRMYHYRCRLLSAQLRAAGMDVDPAAWKAPPPSYYSRLKRRLGVLEDIAALVPPGARFVLVDDGAFGGDALLPDRTFVRLDPADVVAANAADRDTEVVPALEALRARGAEFLVFALNAASAAHHARLRELVASRYPCELVTDSLVAFHLAP